jgi:hypothetical protein
LIQYQFRRYRMVKLARMQLIYVICQKPPISETKAWQCSSNNQKFEALAHYLLKVCYEHSRSRCKYLNDTKKVNTKFTRNMNFWANDVVSSAFGREITLYIPPPPFFTFLNRDRLLHYISALDFKFKRRKVLKRSVSIKERSYY